MHISLAETFFLLLITSITAVVSYVSWQHILPRLPVRVPPVLVCITIGCLVRLISKPMLESPSADAYLQAGATPKTQHMYGEGVVRSISSPVISLCLGGVGLLIGSHIDLPFLRQHTRALVSLTVCCVVCSYSFTFGAAFFYSSFNAALVPFIHLAASTAIERSSGEALATISDMKSLSSTHAPVVFFAKSTIFLGAVMDICSVVVFVLSLAMIKGNEKVQLKKGASVDGSSSSSSSGGLWYVHVAEICFGTLFLVGLVFAVRLLHNAIVSKTVSCLSWLMNKEGDLHSNGGGGTAEEIRRKEEEQRHAMVHGGTVSSSSTTASSGSQQQSVSFVSSIFNSAIAVLTSPSLQHERDAVLVLLSLMLGNYLIPGAELLLAAVVVGMRLTYLQRSGLSCGSTTLAKGSENDLSLSAAALATAGDESTSPPLPPPSPSKADHHAKFPASATPAAAAGSVVDVVEANSTMVYAVLFGIIGLRLDASQLVETLLAAPRFALLLFGGRVWGLVLGGFGGAVIGNCRTYMKWRGCSLVTRIAVSIILLQKMEDALPAAKPIVHAALGAVFLDMCVGPPLLQFVLRKVEADAAATAESAGVPL